VALDILEMDIFVADYLAIFFARVNGNRLQVSLNFCSLAPAFAAFSVTTGFPRYATFTPKHGRGTRYEQAICESKTCLYTN
jgi:hypothetical protein